MTAGKTHGHLLQSAVSRRGMLMGAGALVASRWTDARAGEITPNAAAQSPPFVYVGTYTPPGRGISIFHIDPPTNALTLASTAAPVPSPSFLALDPTKKFLYAGNETSPGTVMAFSINSSTGDLTLLNTQPAGGGPAHVIVHQSGKFLFVANYTGSTVEVVPINSDGSLGTPTQLIRQFGDLGPNAGRQEAPHPHMSLPDPTGNYVLVNDLGLDTTSVYALDMTAGTMTLKSLVKATPGSGPRHLAFNPNGKVVYSINEMASTLNVYAWDSTNGILTSMQSDVSTLPPGFQGNSTCAEVQINSAGTFLYASNRGHDSLAIYSVDSSGLITFVGFQATQGDGPRYFTFDPSGVYLHVANQNTNNIVTYKADPGNGSLTTVAFTASPSPVCMMFAY